MTGYSDRFPVDPKEVLVNIRYLSNKTIPTSVRKAMRAISNQAEVNAPAQGFLVDGQDRYAISLYFVMNDRRADLDGPLKRAMDALADGLKINDGHVDEIHVYRRVGEPEIRVDVASLEDGHDKEEEPEGFYMIPGSSFLHGVKK